MPTTVQTCDEMSDRLSGLVLKRPLGLGWLGGLLVAFSLLMLLKE